jgi:hypothetical protein
LKKTKSHLQKPALRLGKLPPGVTRQDCNYCCEAANWDLSTSILKIHDGRRGKAFFVNRSKNIKGTVAYTKLVSTFMTSPNSDSEGYGPLSLGCYISNTRFGMVGKIQEEPETKTKAKERT